MANNFEYFAVRLGFSLGPEKKKEIHNKNVFSHLWKVLIIIP